MTIRFGVIGCGAIGRWHAISIGKVDGAVLSGVTDRSSAAAGNFAEEFGARSYESVEEMLASDDIDAVSICTPSGLHADLAVKAAEAGKHILMEKPMALTIADCDRIISAVDKAGVKAGVVFQSRFKKTAKTLKELVDQGKLGKIICADVFMRYYRSPEYYAASGWRGTWAMDGGGALMNQGIHSVDLLQYIMGPVKSVMAEARTLYHKIEVEDTVGAVVEFESGAIGLIQATTAIHPGYPRILTLSGTNGSVSISDDDFISWDIKDIPLPEDITLGYEKANLSSSDPMSFPTDGHEKQISDMVDAIINDRDPMISCREGKKSVLIIQSVYRSSNEGKRIILE